MNLLKNFILLILSIQEKILTKSLKTKKSFRDLKVLQNKVTMAFNSIEESERQKIEEDLMLILKSSNFNPKEILNYIKKHDTDILYTKTSKILNVIGLNTGFIVPLEGIKALILSFFYKKKIAFKTPELFILPYTEIDKYNFIYHFYNWYAFKHNLAGLDYKTQQILNKFLYNTNEDLSKFQLNEIINLKNAIKQDKYAIDFVLKLCQEMDSSQKALEKIKNGGANL